MIRKILTIAAVDLRVTHTGAGLVVFRVLVPIALILVIGYANGAFLSGGIARPATHLAVLDEDSSDLSTYLVDSLASIDDLLVVCPGGEGCPAYSDPESALREGDVDGLLRIPAGFEASLNTEAAARLELSTPATNSDARLDALLQAALGRVQGVALARNWAGDLAQAVPSLSRNYPQAVTRRARELWSAVPVSVHRVDVATQLPEDTRSESGGGFQQSVPGMGSMYVMFGVLGGVALLVWERKNWTLQRLATMPVSRGVFIGGKFLSRLVLGMVQFGVAFLTGAAIGLVTDVTFGSSPLGLIVTMLSFVAFTAALTLFLATIVRSPQQASAVTTFLALTLAPIGGAWWSLDLEFVPQIMREIAVISPFYWAMKSFTAIIRFGAGFEAAVLPCLVLLGSGALLLILAVARFRVEQPTS